MKGARLGTLQTIAEVGVISNKASKVLGRDTGTLWVGLKRKNECLNQKLTKSCTKKTSFTAIDETTDQRAFKFWGCKQPDNEGLDKNEAVLLFGRTEIKMVEEHGKWVVGRYYSASIDGLPKKSVKRATVGYICGKYAKIRGK